MPLFSNYFFPLLVLTALFHFYFIPDGWLGDSIELVSQFSRNIMRV